MSLRFHYELSAMPFSILPLGGRFVRPRPIIPITIIGPSGASLKQAILDPASDDTVFPEYVARMVGVNLANAPQGKAAGVGLVTAILHTLKFPFELPMEKSNGNGKPWLDLQRQ